VSLVDLCVRRPVFATMLLVALVVVGLASYRDLGLDIFPKVDIPTVTVTTRLPGASPEEVESQVTKRIEEVVNTISGIDELRSTTIEGQSQVFVSFILDRDIESAAQDVREKVATILSQLPQGTEPPVIEKFDVDAAPVLALVVSGRRSAREITELADKRVKRALEGVKDIGAVTLVGQRKREIQIAVDPNRLTAYGLSIQQLQTALLRQNVEVPGGRLTGEGREEGLRTLGRVTAVGDFETIVVAETLRGPVRVRDVAQVLDAEEEPRTLSRLDGQNAVSLLVRKQSGTNTVAVVDRVKARLTDL
jgi:hydrophobic/amphiphilic exporter-1 (mainly G- bacteria), HAE1 family